MKEAMESFLNASKAALAQLSSYETIRVILGNPTCDLDSAVCALVQGLLEYTEAKQCEQNSIAVIPVINIPQKEFRIKTEVVHSLRAHSIPLNLITFRDQINLQNVNDAEKKLELILVDHHTLPNEDIVLKPSVVAIIDHRPLDPTWSWSDVSLTVEIVGSCATLVARNVLQKHPDMLDAQISSFLRGPILIDTYNMSAKAGRVTAVDIDVLNSLERLGGLTSDSRTETFNELMKAKTDISELTLEELMIKDLKVTNNIPLVGFSLLVENFLLKENAEKTIEKFTNDRNCAVTVLIGQDVSGECVSRDIAVFSTSSSRLGSDIIEALTSCTQPYLNLDLIKEIRSENYSLYLYKQRNVSITRKQILPIVQKAASRAHT